LAKALLIPMCLPFSQQWLIPEKNNKMKIAYTFVI
jgi:hypothetical protein